MRRNLTRLLGIGAFCLSFYTYGQQKPITGRVVDAEGFPVQDAYVFVEGSDKGVYADENGNFTIQASPGEKVKVEFIGFDPKTFVVGDKTSNYSVKLDKGVISLSPVVQVAYGTQKREELVGSITTINQDILSKQQASNVTSALQGNAPGVNVISSGGPGDSPTIRIRGIGSINAGVDPLIVVDGVPYNGHLNSISQDQVESVSVLKDAGSTALYGSRGANGVILITTKTGRKDSSMKITLSSSFGVSNLAQDIYQMVGAEDFLKLTWEAIKNGKLDSNPSNTSAGVEASNELINYLGYNPYNVQNPIDENGNLVQNAKLLWDTNWRDAILDKNALRNDIKLSFEGGGSKTSYYFGLDYLNQDGLIKTSNFTRYTTRLNLRSDLKDWLKAGVNTSFTKSQTNYPIQSGSDYGSAMQWIYSVPNVYPVYRRDANGNYILDRNGNKQFDYGTGSRQTVNAYREIYNNENVPGILYNNSDHRNRYNFSGNGFLDFEIIKNLHNKTTLGYEFYVYDNKRFSSSEVGAAASVKGRAISERRIQTTLNFNNATSYKFSLGKHNFGLDGIFEIYDYDYDYLDGRSTGFLPGVYVHSGSLKPESLGGYVNKERMESYLGRVSYNFAKKYFLEGSFRKDGSSKFSKATRWGDFYSIGGSWIISNEDFFKNDIANFLKVKVSYGELGNNTGIGYFPYLRAYSTGFSQLDNIGTLLENVVDANLSWEKTASFNAGIEFGFFNNRLSGTVDYYNKKSVDLIYDKPLPLSSGNESIKTNVGTLRNYGLEFTLNSLNIDKEFKWRTSLNFSLDRNEIKELTVESFISGNKKWEAGRSLYDFYMPTYAGVNPENGKVMWYKDVKDATTNQVKRETTEDYNEATREYQDKTSLPDIIGGLTNTFSYKNFDLNFLFNFSIGAYLYDSQLANMQRFSDINQASVDVLKRWQKKGDITDVPILTTSRNDFNALSSRFLFRNDYVRLKALTFGYTLPSNITNQVGLDTLRFYLQGDNLWTWQSHKGVDPEQAVSGNTDYRAINMKTVSFGVSLTF